MLDHGHPDARIYPVSKVFAEARYVVDRINAQIATEISLMQLAFSSIPNQSVKQSATKKAAKSLVEQLKGMFHGGS